MSLLKLSLLWLYLSWTSFCCRLCLCCPHYNYNHNHLHYRTRSLSFAPFRMRGWRKHSDNARPPKKNSKNQEPNNLKNVIILVLQFTEIWSWTMRLHSTHFLIAGGLGGQQTQISTYRLNEQRDWWIENLLITVYVPLLKGRVIKVISHKCPVNFGIKASYVLSS